MNRYLRAYSIAAEDAAVRMLTPEAIDAAYAAIELSGEDPPLEPERRPFRLPSATRHQSSQAMDEELLLRRIQQGIDSTNYQHPLDDVILWCLRAEHHADYAGDYELAVVALETSVERRIYATRSVMLVDDGLDTTRVAASINDSYKSAFNDLGTRLHGGSWT